MDSRRMTSVAALHTRIEEISLAIRDLEQAKRDAQSDLNNILDPMARLPLEISSDIFMRCLPDKPIPNVDDAPLVFLKICRSWNKIAISTPSLWTVIHIEAPFPYGVYDLLKLWFGRASSRPLAISLHGSLDSGVRAAVDEYAHQVQILALYLPSGDDLAEITTPLPSLNTLIIGQGPRDEDSDAEGFDAEGFDAEGFDAEGSEPEADCCLGYSDVEKPYSGGASECVEMLRNAPGLVDCTLDRIFYATVFHTIGNYSDFGECDELTHHSLTNLRLNSSALILRYLTLPALESLDISDVTHIDDDHLPNFLIRSSPPLKSLKMQWVVTWSGGMAERILRLLPNLTDLDMGFWSSQTISTLLGLLATGPTQFLPNLRNLTIHGMAPVGRPQYQTLVSAISARRASSPPRIETFRLIWRFGEDKPDADIIAALQQLVGDGMGIHIGTAAENFV
ncbi:hypothetical protein DFH09DRAFT_1321751 [Mycena vulgaris]|nr:hypothetical protein DFH09DRAFT_1321751 [Mycena vulgaris]